MLLNQMTFIEEHGTRSLTAMPCYCKTKVLGNLFRTCKKK